MIWVPKVKQEEPQPSQATSSKHKRYCKKQLKEVVGEKYSTKYKWVPKASLTKVAKTLAWVPKKVSLPPTLMFTQKKGVALKRKQPSRVEESEK